MARARKSKITRMPAEQRAFVEKLLREDRLTLSEMMDALRATFPDADVSRSGLHRYQSNFAELTSRMREIDRAAEALVGELGDGIGEKAGALLAHAVTTLATDAALRAQNDPDVTIDEVRKIAIAARNSLDTRRLSMAERKGIQAEARERMLSEQKERLAKIERKSGMTADVADQIRREILGIG